MMCEEITKLIPQREPIRMVDRLTSVDGDVALTTLTVRQDNYFIDEEGLFAEPGLIEHIAQSASAFAGYRAMEAGATTPPIGYIGEVKKFHCYRRPCVGDELSTKIIMGAEVDGVTIVSGETSVGNEIVADTQMKIFIRKNQ